MTYYTLQVHYNGPKEKEVMEFKDIESTTLEILRKAIFQSGIKIQTSPTTHEWISPFRINTAFAIKQDKKFAD